MKKRKKYSLALGERDHFVDVEQLLSPALQIGWVEDRFHSPKVASNLSRRRVILIDLECHRRALLLLLVLLLLLLRRRRRRVQIWRADDERSTGISDRCLQALPLLWWWWRRCKRLDLTVDMLHLVYTVRVEGRGIIIRSKR